MKFFDYIYCLVKLMLRIRIINKVEIIRKWTNTIKNGKNLRKVKTKGFHKKSNEKVKRNRWKDIKKIKIGRRSKKFGKNKNITLKFRIKEKNEIRRKNKTLRNSKSSIRWIIKILIRK